MNRRMALLAAGAIALLGVGAVAALKLGGSEGRVTLKSRILDYDKSRKSMRPRPSLKEIEAHITAMMGEYFHIGMSYQEVVKILEENALIVDSTSVNERDWRFDEPAYFDVTIISVLKIPTWNLLVSFQYRIFFGFKNKGLDTFRFVRIGTGP